MNRAIFLTTRLGSTRLPQKCTLKTKYGTMTEVLLKRLKRSGEKIILCVPNLPQDIKYFKGIAEEHKIGFFSGALTNIWKRHYACAVENNITHIINCDGDDVLADPYIIKQVTSAWVEGVPAVTTVNYPYGMNIIGYTVEVAQECAEKNLGDTYWGKEIEEYPHLVIPSKRDYHNVRISLDTIDDYEMLKKTINKLGTASGVTTISEYIHKEITHG